MIKKFNIQRSITFYEKEGDAFIDDRVLLEEEFSLEELKEIFDHPKNDPLLYEQYDINKKIATVINNKINFDFDFDKYDYFFETFSVDINTEIGNGIRLKDH